MAPMSPSVLVQLISSTIACTGFALWFNIRGKQVVYSSIGAFICWGVYVIVYHYNPSNFYATMVASIVIAGYAQIMARVNKAPATVFLTAPIFPVIPGAQLYWMMYGLALGDNHMAKTQGIDLIVTCLAIALGFMIIEIFNKYLSLLWSRIRRSGRKTA
jgi:uncharacterized membrane protein YjjB (DUF3815 family)